MSGIQASRTDAERIAACHRAETLKLYPEHAKMEAVREKSQAIGEFLEWLTNERNLSLAAFDGFSGENGMLQQVYFDTNELLAEYFHIDLKVIETEKRAMLDALRKGGGV